MTFSLKLINDDNGYNDDNDDWLPMATNRIETEKTDTLKHNERETTTTEIHFLFSEWIMA